VSEQHKHRNIFRLGLCEIGLLLCVRSIRETAFFSVPDFLVRLKDMPRTTIILETKRFDPLADLKASAAARWVSAVNAEQSYGLWRYELARNVSSVSEKIAAV
jgi:hypothetical protein